MNSQLDLFADQAPDVAQSAVAIAAAVVIATASAPAAANSPVIEQPIVLALHKDPDTIEAKIERAERALRALIERGGPISVSYSGGKDSSCVLNLLLCVASHVAEEGKPVPPIVITHADTGIENPEMVGYVQSEMASIRAFAKKYGLDVSVHTSHPLLTETFAVRVIGGRALPPFPGVSRDCTREYKVSPMHRLRKRLMAKLQEKSGMEVVTLLGTRYAESATRAASMAERAESDIDIRRGIESDGRPGGLFLSPIAYWLTDDVWEYLGYARAGVVRAYSDFDETFRLYADALGSSCVIVGEDMAAASKTAKACGARHGCSLCTAVGRDHSMENMLAKDERYAYMRGLNKLQQFLVNTRWDMDRRQWVGRTINKNHIRIMPDAYSPGMMEELLRYALTLDLREQRAASELGIRPRFRLVTEEQLFAIDAVWSLQAYHRPFHALSIYRDVFVRGQEYDIPDVAPFPKPAKMPTPRYYPVAEWDEGFNPSYLGLRDHLLDMVKTEGDGCMGTVHLADGTPVLDINTSSLFSIEMETAYFILEDEWMDRLIREYHDNDWAMATQGYKYYLELGMLSVRAGRQAEIDQILRRSNFKIRNGFAGQISSERLAELLAASKTAAEAGLIETTNGKKIRGGRGSRGVVVESLIEADTPAPEQAAGAANDENELALEAA